MSLGLLILSFIFGYLLGSIPFGLLLTRIAGTEDIRDIGSGNIGATNVLRTGRKDLAAATLAFDIAKGAFAVLIGKFFGADAAIIAGVGAFIGHLYPIWLRWKGGKGVATFLGILAILWWPGLFIFLAVWLTIAYVTRYSSLAALFASLISVLAVLTLSRSSEGDKIGVAFLGMGILLWFKHEQNIIRLLQGEESKIGEGDKTTEEKEESGLR